MAIRKLSDDAARDWYHDGTAPDFAALQDDNRIRARYDRNDWSTGDVVYCEDDCALRLTGTGAPLWQWDQQYN